MKKLSITVKTLFLGVLALAAASCSNKNTETTAAAAPAAGEEAAAPAINIRYIDADSVMSAYVLAQQIAEESQRELLRYQQQEQQKQRELQTLGNSIQQKQQNNVYMTEASFQADVQNFNKKQQEAERYLGAQQQKIQTAMAAAQQRLNDSISNFVRDYNATKGYDAILMREAGVYFKPELNITAEIIEGLNARFQASNEAAK
ncbi:MAG: OmpH family outer membrane protein [Muribaculaceae bacterium]|nr:OmpH family outer membrane protein [Muribaculaceae bacterium]